MYQRWKKFPHSVSYHKFVNLYCVDLNLRCSNQTCTKLLSCFWLLEHPVQLSFDSRQYLLQLHHDERVGRWQGHVLGRDGAGPGRSSRHSRHGRVQFQILEPQVQVVLEVEGSNVNPFGSFKYSFKNVVHCRHSK